MNPFPLPPLISLLIGLCIILLILCGIVVLTTWTSIRLSKVQIPKLRILFIVAFLQILLGVVVTAILRAMKVGPLTGVGAGIGTTILAGFLIMKLVLHNSWKQALRVWGVAAAMQLILIPICLVVLLAILMMLSYWIYPPIY
jgi:hypothetical protein